MTSSNEKKAARYMKTRAATLAICEPLETEDHVVQPHADISPPKWHLGHTTWFFEEFVLRSFARAYRPFPEAYREIFNSYYKGVGPHWPQAERGALSRPTLREIMEYRRQVDTWMIDLILKSKSAISPDASARLDTLVSLGLNHEQQHQELLLMDIQFIFALDPLGSVYLPIEASRMKSPSLPAAEFTAVPEGLYEAGAARDSGFAYDNETSRHRVHLSGFRIRNRPVTNGEFIEFIRDGGYDDPRLWLSDGWEWIRRNGISAPLYWSREGKTWIRSTLHGLREVEEDAPVCHVSYHEAAAFAEWTGKRLPTEHEWEITAASDFPHVAGGFLDDGCFIPRLRMEPSSLPKTGAPPLFGFMGGTWEWTASAYLPYPGHRKLEGTAGEYNGKFMSGRMVLRGGSVATPRNHARVTYRNYFQPEKRWCFSGFRLAEDLT